MRPLDPRLLRDRAVVRPLIGLSAVGAVVDVAVTVVQAVLLARAFAAVVAGTSSVVDLGRTAIALAAVTALQALLGWLVTVRGQGAATTVTARIRHDVLERTIDDAEVVAPGELAVLATRGVDAMQPYLARYVPQLVRASIVPLALVGVIAVVDLPSAAILVVTLPLVPVFMVLVGRFSERRAAASWSSVTGVSRHVHDVISGMSTLKRFGRHRAQREVIERMSARSCAVTMASLRIAFLSAFVLELAASVSVALVAVPLGIRLVDGDMALATAFVVLLLTPEVFAPLRRVGAEYHTATEGIAAVDQALEILHRDRPDDGGVPVPDRMVVACADVTVDRGERGMHPHHAGLVAAPGEVVAVVGVNGAGKTTLLDVLRGAVRPTSGQVVIDGVPLDAIDRHAWRDAVAWVPQRAVLTDDTVWANIGMGASAAPTKIVEVARDLGIGHLLDRRARSLSAGERQRVALARAVVRVEAGSGRLVLLDEPSANLDDATEQAVIDVVRRLAAQGATVVVVAHRAALVASSDRVVEIHGDADATSVGPSPAIAAGGERATIPTAARAEPPAVIVPPAAGRRAPAARWLWDLSRGVRGRLAAAIVLGALATASALGLVACAAWLLSRASQQPAILSLTTVVVLVRAFALAKAGSRYAERLASHDAVLRLIGRLRARVVDRLAVVAPAGLTGRRHGDVLARLLGDLDEVEAMWLRALLPPVVAALVGVLLVATVAVVSPVAGVILLVGLLVGGGLVPWWCAHLEAERRRHGAAERARLTGDVVDVAEAAAELGAYGATTVAMAPIARRQAALAAQQRREARVGGSADALETTMRAVAAAALLVATGGAAIDGSLGVLLVPSLVLLAWVLPEVVGGLPVAARHLHDLRPAAARMVRLLDADDPTPDPVEPRRAPEGPVDVVVDGVTLRWPDAMAPAVTDAHIAIPAGGTVVVMGPSGAGKSTLAAALVGFLRPEAGTIRIGGVDVTELRGDDLRRLVGWCAQDTHLFDATVRDNLRIARPDATDDELTAALRRVGLGGWLAMQPEGLGTVVGPTGCALSGGEAQRLALAQVVLADASVVVLDEPTAHLDPGTAASVLADLLAATHGRTTLVITHHAIGVEPGTPVVHLDARPAATGNGDTSVNGSLAAVR